jgi:hypothetical protein
MKGVYKKRGGYVGLLGLLITVALISILVWRSDLFGGAKQKTIIEQDTKAIDSAQQVKQILEKQSRQTSEQL